MFVTITPDGTTTKHDHKPNLEELQMLVGGYIEERTLRLLGEVAVLIVGEEAKAQGLPVNAKVTNIALAGGVKYQPGDAYRGTGVLVGVDDDGETADLPLVWQKRLGLR